MFCYLDYDCLNANLSLYKVKSFLFFLREDEIVKLKKWIGGFGVSSHLQFPPPPTKKKKGGGEGGTERYLTWSNISKFRTRFNFFKFY